MFVTPMISSLVANSLVFLTHRIDDEHRYPVDYCSSHKRSSTRYSSATVSSDASSLHRTLSTDSNGSTSRWSTSSTSSVETTTKLKKHRKSASAGSFHLPRALQPFHKKALAQLQTNELKAPPTSTTSSPRSPVPSQAPPRPPRPEDRAQRRSDPRPAAPSAGDPSSQWQFSDLVVRCKDEVYHVDRTIMCYHSRWFARICTIIKNPVCIMILL
jgi:hypothetical protein